MADSMQNMSDTLIIPEGSFERFLFFGQPAPNEKYHVQPLIGGISDLTPGYQVGRKHFYAHELIFPVEGKLEISLPEGSIQLKPGEVIFLPAPQLHYYGSHEPLRFIWFHIHPELLTPIPAYFWRPARYAEEIRLLAELLYLEERKNPRQGIATGKALWKYLENEIYADNHEHRHLQRLEQIFEQVNRNLRRPWTIPEMARLACLSESHFYSIVKEIYQAAPLEILRKMRMETGAALLLRSNHDLTTIAEQTGYADASSFSKAFSKYYRCSPRTFRDRYTE